MREANFDDGLMQEYLAECREHLANIETDLLEIERAGAAIDEELVNRVFRAAHSIKGGAGFLDLTKIRDLAHNIENVLDLIRSRQMIPAPDVVSLLLVAFDRLRDLIANYRESNEADVADCADALVRLSEDHLPDHQKRSVTETVSIPIFDTDSKIEVSAFDLNQARRSGKCVYLVRYDLIHDIHRLGQAPYEVLKGLMQYGTILQTLLDLDSAGTLDDEPSNELRLAILYASVLGPDLIRDAVHVAPDCIRLIERDDVAAEPGQTLPEPAPPLAVPPEEVLAVEPLRPMRMTAAGEAIDIQAPRTEAPKAEAPAGADPTIRINVSLLDSLMTLAGELVLSRNQLNESVARQDSRGIHSSAQRVNLVTSELQELVTLTRMQPVGSVFAKFPRIVRDLSKQLGKDARIKLEGGEVELDKTILEGLSDPLTHMIRNAVDHGIEPPDVRVARGKPRTGTITLKASHQAGLVVIEVSDDGKGLDARKVVASTLAKGMVTREQLQSMTEREKLALILLPGVSTAEKISDVSGRGVGMDVVKTNLEKLGGKMEIESAAGTGTSFRIKLPLTLAIIPSLLISDRGERFAIPQVNVGELIRIPAGQVGQRIDRVGEAEVLILRDRLVPLVRLSGVLGLRREVSAGAALNVVLVDTGVFEYGLIVEELHETVEIVVKPLGRHLKALAEYAGATILGDGRVAVILDVAGLAARAGLTAASAQIAARQETEETTAEAEGDVLSLLLFHNAESENCAVPIDLVARIERIRPGQIELLGGRRTMQYRNASLPVIALSDVAGVGQICADQDWVVIVFEYAGRALGLLAAEPLDMVEARVVVDRRTLRQPGIGGSAVLNGRTTLLVDILEVVEKALPEWAEEAPRSVVVSRRESAGATPTVLLAEDSDFFRSQLKRLIEAIGYSVLAAEDGQAAWELLDEHADEVALVTTDIEMPRMDGLALTRRIRADARFVELPIIAVSTLAGEDEVARGVAAGVTEYQIKLNKDELINSIQKAVGARALAVAQSNEPEMES